MREPIEREIGVHTYRVRPMSAEQALGFWVELTQVVGEAAADALVTAIIAGHEHLAGMLPDLLGLLPKVTQKLSRDQTIAWKRQLEGVSQVQIPEKGWVDLPKISTLHFDGYLEELLPWLAFAVEVQARPFVQSLIAMVGAPLMALASAHQADAQAGPPDQEK